MSELNLDDVGSFVKLGFGWSRNDVKEVFVVMGITGPKGRLFLFKNSREPGGSTTQGKAIEAFMEVQ